MKKIVLIGDSIRMGYDKYVKLSLEGSAQVYYPAENCRFTQYVLRYFHEWIGQSGFGEETDVVHWNVGLWDVLELFGDGPTTSLSVYEDYLHRICHRIRQCCPKAKVIFATSTPVWQPGYKNPKRWYRDNRVIEQYNAAAVNVVKAYGFAVNDLYELLKNVPESYYSDMTHFYTKEATERITNQVLESIAACVDVQIKPLDYSQHFGTDSDDV